MASPTVITALEHHPFLEGLKPLHLEKLASMAFEVTFEPEQMIFREADPSSFFYLILEGTIALEVRTPVKVIRIQTIGAGEELGWSSLLSQVNKQFQARSLEPVRALAFDGTRLVMSFETDHEFGYFLLRKILQTVADRLQATRLQMLDIYAKKGAQK
jgi:CRP/FNR family cyclic AMP-dependent transcriptional regulator